MTSARIKLWLKLPILAFMLLGLPSSGIVFSGQDIGKYLEFPPVADFVQKAPFSWKAFVLFAGLIFLVAPPLAIQAWKAVNKSTRAPASRILPWWGWLGLGCLCTSWIVAWNRFSWAEPLQNHTFFPLWIGYIVVVNALTYRKTGLCMITDHFRYFLILFPVSAFFWWFFEYLNRFVQNWHYTGTQYGATLYFVLASLSFSTVLPAVLGTRDFLLSHNWLKKEFKVSWPISIPYPRIAALAGLVLSGFSLFFIGLYPDILFPFVWISPLLIILTLKTLVGEKHLLYLHYPDNQRIVMASLMAALICGFFWEMWNYWSLVKWQYTIPFVDRYHLFEMPVLGYSGYLPFGLECAVIGQAVQDFFKR